MEDVSPSKIRQTFEKEMHEEERGNGWRCVAATRDLTE